jgi:amidase
MGASRKREFCDHARDVAPRGLGSSDIADARTLRLMNREDAGAFVDGPRRIVEGAEQGPLAGLTFTAKDLYDVEGLVTGAGNAARRSETEPAVANADAVQRLLDAGAHLDGTTVTVEFAWSLTGRNPHDGLADNPADPYGVPGGSSAGAAAATAAGLCDLALGTDTGGSVRVPAAYCGLLGIRPTHGRVDDTGVLPLSPSFDTVGWFARDPHTLSAAANVLLSDPPAMTPGALPDGVTVLSDAFAQATTEVMSGLDGLVGAVADQVGGSILDVELADLATWDRWVGAFGLQQRLEAWEQHGDFYTRHGSSVLGDDVAERFEDAKQDAEAGLSVPDGIRDEVAERIEELTDGGTRVLLLPAAPSRAPRRATPESDGAHRAALLRLTCIASMGGAPAVTLPSRTQTGTQVGLSLLGAPGSDEMLLDLAARVFELMSF